MIRAGVRSLLEVAEDRRWLVVQYKLILETFVHDLLNELEASSVIVFWYAKPCFLDEVERYRTTHADVAAVCDSSSLPYKVHRGNAEYGQRHSLLSSSGNPLFCSGVPQVPWSKDAKVAVKPSCLVP